MNIQQYVSVHENRIRPDIRAMLEYHILEALPLRAACLAAGLPYHKNVSQHKFSKAGRAYVTQLKRRRKVILEFGIDELALARLIELRDQALEAGSHVAALRAHELCLKAAAKAKADGKEVGGKKDIDRMSRAEVLAEIQEIKSRVDGKSFEIDIDPQDVEYLESREMSK
jgi:hypothetical protein